MSTNPSRNDLVAKALSFVGTAVGDGYNCPNPFSADLGLPTEAWCADFVTDIFKRADGRTGPPPPPSDPAQRGPLALPPMQAGHSTGYSYCPSGLAYAHEKNAIIWSWNASPGDIVFFCWDGSGHAQHTGIVEKWSEGVLHTIEGNSGSSGGVNRGQYSAPSGVGNAQIIGVADTSKLVNFGATLKAAVHPALTPSVGVVERVMGAEVRGPVPAHAPPPEYTGFLRKLSLCSPAMRGKDVEVVQDALKTVSLEPGTRGVYDAATADAVLKFQNRFGLSVMGIVDSVTRKALGFPMDGVDASTDCSPIARTLAGAGYGFVCRYYASPGSTKVLTRLEAETLSAAGLSIVVVYETNPTAADYFSAAQGKTDGQAAYEYARDVIKQPQGSAIYFAVDFDVQAAAIGGAITDYFSAIRDAFSTEANGDAPAYKIGVYGSGLTCASLHGVAGVEVTWLAMSQAWSGHDFANWNIRQNAGTTVGTIDVDSDQAREGYGGFIVS